MDEGQPVVIKGVRVDTRLIQSLGDGPARSFTFGVHVGDAIRVCAGAVADDLGQRLRPPLLGMIESFEDHDARTFPHDEAVPRAIEGARSGFVIIITRGEGGETAEAGHPKYMEHGVRAARDHHVRIASLEHAGRLADGLGAGGAGGEAVIHRASQAVLACDMRCGHVRFLFDLEPRIHIFVRGFNPLDRIHCSGGFIPACKIGF